VALAISNSDNISETATIKGGRPSDPVRQFVFKLDGSKTKCVISNREVSNRIERLKAHRKHCSKQATDSCVSTGVKRALTDIDHDDEIGCTPPPAKRKAILQPQLSGFTVRTNSKTAAAFDEQIARFFYARFIPFNVTEQKEFKSLISMLRPGCTPHCIYIKNYPLCKPCLNLK